ncbi:MAG: molybdopterin-dependent oxidoreductase [Rhodospirillaceae bacterium]|nr:molybdopterin-dependent oxidoreductase [Rhodospirillaceae bacterium]
MDDVAGRARHPAALAENSVPGICGICAAGCGVNVHFVDGRIDRLTPLKDHPLGIVCPRGMRAREIVYSPDRILYPQKRVGKRGEGAFERIGWDEAYELLVAALKDAAAKHGPESTCIYTGRGNFEFGLNEAFAPADTIESSANAVLFPFGSPNTTGVGSLCYASYGMIAPKALFGDYIRNIHEDLENAGLVLVWGANPATDSPPANLRRLKQAKARGARIAVIDHRRTETVKATQGDWIGIRPGTDGALALGMIHVVIAEHLYDRDFVAGWTHGFDQLASYTRDFTPERVAAITGIPQQTIRDLARAVAEAKGCAILTYTGLEYSDSGLQAIRAVWTLQAICGHLDAPGGKLFKMPGRVQTRRILTEPPANGPKPIGAAEYPLYYAVRRELHGGLIPRAVLEGIPYPLRLLIVSGASLITAWPDPDLWRRALAGLDYLVTINRFPTADMAYADLVLPATTMFEIMSYVAHDNHVQLRRRVIPPRGEARNDYLIFAELAQRLGYGERWPQSEEGLVRHMLTGTGISFEDLLAKPEGIALPQPEMRYRKYATGALRADGRPGFETPTGKFEIASEWLRSYGYDAVPVYTEPREGPLAAPATAAKFPLVFNSGARTQTAFRSQHFNIPPLAAQQPLPLVQLHPSDAASRGIKDGDPVFVTSPRGRVPFWANVTPDIVAGTVEVNMGGGGPLGGKAWQAANVNELTDPANSDPLSGFPVFKALLCDVVPRAEPQ